MIEHIGNKTPFERKLNIIASNGYFKKKQQEYQKSKIEVTKILVTSINDDWTLGNIEHRDKIVATEIMQLLQDWESNYQKNRNNAATPSEEDLAMIEKFKQKGWI